MPAERISAAQLELGVVAQPLTDYDKVTSFTVARASGIRTPFCGQSAL
jgi:hypothetical protein